MFQTASSCMRAYGATSGGGMVRRAWLARGAAQSARSNHAHCRSRNSTLGVDAQCKSPQCKNRMCLKCLGSQYDVASGCLQGRAWTLTKSAEPSAIQKLDVDITRRPNDLQLNLPFNACATASGTAPARGHAVLLTRGGCHGWAPAKHAEHLVVVAAREGGCDCAKSCARFHSLSCCSHVVLGLDRCLALLDGFTKTKQKRTRSQPARAQLGCTLCESLPKRARSTATTKANSACSDNRRTWSPTSEQRIRRCPDHPRPPPLPSGSLGAPETLVRGH